MLHQPGLQSLLPRRAIVDHTKPALQPPQQSIHALDAEIIQADVVELVRMTDLSHPLSESKTFTAHVCAALTKDGYLFERVIFTASSH